MGLGKGLVSPASFSALVLIQQQVWDPFGAASQSAAPSVCVRGGNGKHEENEGERVNTQKGGTGEACAPPPWSPPPDPARRGSALRERQSIAWHRIAWHLHWKPPAGLGTDERAFLDLDLQKHVVEGPLQHREENEGKKERRAQNAAHTRGKEQMAPGSDERSRIACRRKHEEEAAKK